MKNGRHGRQRFDVVLDRLLGVFQPMQVRKDPPGLLMQLRGRTLPGKVDDARLNTAARRA